MAKYTVILSYGQHSDPDHEGTETFLAHVNTKAQGYFNGGEVAAINNACDNIRRQNAWKKSTHPNKDFPVLYVFYGYCPAIQSHMD